MDVRVRSIFLYQLFSFVTNFMFDFMTKTKFVIFLTVLHISQCKYIFIFMLSVHYRSRL